MNSAAPDSDPAGKGEWIAGFISPGDLSKFVDELAAHSFTWERRMLLVIDYAAQCHVALGRWLNRLVSSKLDTKLRILLLDREAPESFGWWHDLTSPALRSEQARRDLFYEPRPRLLPDLSSLDERRSLIAAALQGTCELRAPSSPASTIPPAGADPGFDARLADPQFGNPLSLVMAGVIARDRGPSAALALRRLDAALELGRRELRRLADLAESSGVVGDTMRHIVAFNGLAGGLRLNGLRETLADELTASQRLANLDALLPLLEQEFPTETSAPQSRFATIQPDLIGEAAIIEAFTGQATKEAEALSAVQRAYALGPEMAAQALVRLVQDFGYALEDQSATDGEKRTGQRVMTWLTTLARNIENPVELIPLVSALPLETTILRGSAAELTKRLATYFRNEAARTNDPGAISSAAISVNNLAIRLSNLGRREEAVTAAQEAADLYRYLARAHPEAFTPNLATSLNNLANVLSNLGQREDALAAAEEAVRLFRPLAEACPDAFTPKLAASLDTLANSRRDLGQRDDALAAAEEAVRLYRPLAEARPDASKSGLARLLHTLANKLSDVWRREDALAAAEEAVRLYRALAEACPDAFTPDLAMALNTLVNTLSDVGRREDALATAEEAVRHYRALAAARPEAFTPDLAMSLNNLAAIRFALGRRDEALSEIEEAVRLRRSLAETRPDAGMPDLALSLYNFAEMLCGLGRPKDALVPAEEAVRLYRFLAEAQAGAFTPNLARSLWLVGDLHKAGNPAFALSRLREGTERLSPVFAAAPAAVSDVMRGLVRSYIAHCKAIGYEPDEALLLPIMEIFEQLKTEGEKS